MYIKSNSLIIFTPFKRVIMSMKHSLQKFLKIDPLKFLKIDPLKFLKINPLKFLKINPLKFLKINPQNSKNKLGNVFIAFSNNVKSIYCKVP